MTQVNARIDKEIYDRLAVYSKITGVPVARCIAEACESWLTVVAPSRVEARHRANQEYDRALARENELAKQRRDAVLDVARSLQRGKA
jgi:hypothetical protein